MLKLCDLCSASRMISLVKSWNVDSIYWFAPETLSISPICTSASDMYNLGSIVYSLWTLENTPFAGIEDLKTLVDTITSSTVNPTKWSEKVSLIEEEHVKTLIEKCCKFNPRERITSSEALLYVFQNLSQEMKSEAFEGVSKLILLQNLNKFSSTKTFLKI